MSAGGELELFVGSVKHGVPRHIGDAGDYVEAIVEAERQTRAGLDPHLLPDVEHPVLNGHFGWKVEAELRTKVHLLRDELGAPSANQRRRKA